MRNPTATLKPDIPKIRHQKGLYGVFVNVGAIILVLWLIAYPLSFLPEPIGNNAGYFAEGIRVTVLLTMVSGIAGILLGIVTALAKTSRFHILRWLASSYVMAIRGTPLLVQILFTYFALPILVPWLRLDDFAAASVALSLNVGAFNAEALRAGLLAVPQGQLEAARSLGMNGRHVFMDVVFPQAFKIALPSLANNLIALLKDSSLAFGIGVVELTNVGNRVQAASFQPVPVLLTTAVLYFVLTSLLSGAVAAIESRYHVERRSS
jgi:polar amino acid transport system permease protein